MFLFYKILPQLYILINWIIVKSKLLKNSFLIMHKNRLEISKLALFAASLLLDPVCAFGRHGRGWRRDVTQMGDNGVGHVAGFPVTIPRLPPLPGIVHHLQHDG